MFTQRLSIEHIDEIRELFKDVTGTDYNIKIVKREDIDDAYILNPFDLPDIGEPEEDVAEPTSQKAAEPTLREKQSDGFDEFIKKFSDIIIDADHTFDNFDSSAEQGEQTSFDDDDREEFLEANELPSDDEDD